MTEQRHSDLDEVNDDESPLGPEGCCFPDGEDEYDEADCCPACGGDGMEDDVMPCPYCDGQGYEWWK